MERLCNTLYFKVRPVLPKIVKKFSYKVYRRTLKNS